ncbi:MAG: RES family NAD+ phosphorylase [Deltaproteobacteria bacterium]|nr:RES family NAD+ phosphorylase [Deltaproteobacteria bacterium]
MKFSDSEKIMLQDMMGQIENRYRTSLRASLIEHGLKEHEKQRLLIKETVEQCLKSPALEIYKLRPESNPIYQLHLQNVIRNQAYLEDAKLQIIRDLKRFEPLQKQLEQLKPFHSKTLSFLNEYSASFKKSISILDNSDLNFGLSVEPFGTQYNEPRILIKKLGNDDVGEAGIPVENTAEFVYLPDFISSISIDDALNFFNHLTKFPMLGLKHPVGEKILNGVKKIRLSEIEKQTLFRGRVWEDTQMMPYSELQMFDAPYGEAEQGRFNANGHGFLYVGDSKGGIIQEIPYPNKRALTILQMTLDQKIHILDLTDKPCPIFDNCGHSLPKDSKVNHEYLIPNFIAQCCQIADIKGIKYKSTKVPDMNNYVFFDLPESYFIDKKITQVGGCNNL